MLLLALDKSGVFDSVCKTEDGSQQFNHQNQIENISEFNSNQPHRISVQNMLIPCTVTVCTPLKYTWYACFDGNSLILMITFKSSWEIVQYLAINIAYTHTHIIMHDLL